MRTSWRRSGLILAAAGALLLAPAAGSSKATPKAKAKPPPGAIDLVRLPPRPAGDFRPPERCTPADGGGFTLHVDARSPGQWGGCCVELRPPVALSASSRPAMEVSLEAAESLVEIKFEEGDFGKPTDLAWFYRGPMSKGPHRLATGLVTTNHAPIAAMTAVRMCVAIVGTSGPVRNELTVKSAVVR